MDNQTLTRQELYDLVWSTPRTILAKKYGISDAHLRKICEEMDVPLPKAGHWEKVRNGKEVEIKELSRDYAGKQEITLIPDKDNSGQSPLLKLINEIESDPGLPLVVPDKLNNPDTLILLAKGDTSKNYKGERTFSKSGLNITVEDANVGRALRFMDTFIKLIKARGHQIVVEDSMAGINVNGEKFTMYLREKLQKTPPNKKNLKESVVTVLCFGSHYEFMDKKEWKDGRLPIEQKLATILAFFEIKSGEIKEYQRELERGWAEQKEQARIREEIKNRKEKEMSDFKALLQKAKRWQEVVFIREYIREVEKKDSNKEMSEWLTWARKKADWYDPTIEAEDKLLEDVDRNNLSFKNRWGSFFGGELGE